MKTFEKTADRPTREDFRMWALVELSPMVSSIFAVNLRLLASRRCFGSRLAAR
jgi:hypothetical protein